MNVITKEIINNEDCPECNSKIVKDPITNELFCNNCGLVSSDSDLSRVEDERYFTLQERNKRKRVGLPVNYLYFDKGLSTSIPNNSRDAFGHKLSKKNQYKFYKLRKWHIRSKITDSEDRNLSIALSKLILLADRLELPRYIMKRSSLLYRKVLSKGLVRGRSIDDIIASCLYIEIRKNKLPRYLTEVADESVRTERKIGKVYRLILRELGIKLKPIDPVIFVPRIGETLNVPMSIQKDAIGLLDNVNKRFLTGKHPIGLAGGSIYLASLEDEDIMVNQDDIADICGVCVVTIRNMYKKLQEFNVNDSD